jgi:Na+/phosphate symporter
MGVADVTRGWELAALTLIAVACLAGVPVILLIAKSITTNGEVVGVAIGVYASGLPLALNAIRNLGQTQAMQGLVDQLAQSQPAAVAPTPLTTGQDE